NARAPLQPAGAHDRRPPDVRARLGRRPHGGCQLGGALARRAPGSREAHLPLRLEPGEPGWPHLARVHRGRGEALPGLRVARPARCEALEREHPDLAREHRQAFSGERPAGWDALLPSFEPGKAVATRSAGGSALGALARRVPWLMGGDADLSESTKTALEKAG